IVLWKYGYNELAENILSMYQHRVTGDYLQTSAIFDNNSKVLSSLNDANEYKGPKTGYEMTEERWEKIKSKGNLLEPKDVI
ncbi:MAG: propanediol/glycerol family dehydratase large subunit, partial [Anaerovoracaceae bacterium]